MNIRLILSASTLAIATLAGTAVLAQETTPAPAPKVETPRIDKREANQQANIKEGRESGQLTKHEARRLRAEQRIIDNRQKHMEADGKVTAKEKRRMDRMQDAAGKDVAKQRYDKNTAASAPAPVNPPAAK